MNVLMISDVYFPRINGVSTSIETFRQELRQHGVRVFLIAPDYSGGGDDEDIIRIPARRVIFDPEDRMMRIDYIKKLISSLSRYSLDLVHIQTPFVAHYAGVAIAQKLGLRCITTYHTLFEEYLYHYVPCIPKRWMQGFARRLSRQQCNDVDAVIVPSTAMEERLRTYGVTAPIRRIPTGMPLTQFKCGDRSIFRARHGIGEERPTLLFVGRVAFEKNLEFVLQAVDRARRKIPDLLLVIAGEGPAEKGLKKITRKLDLEQNVHFIGYLDRRSELLDCYSAADAFVFASRTETQGLVLLEAMAVGLPVVSTAVMGTRDILAPKRGALVAPDDLQGFADSLVRMLTDRELRTRLAVDAPHYAREWAADIMAERLLSFYTEVTRKNATS